MRLFILFVAIIGAVWGAYLLYDSLRFDPVEAALEYQERYESAMKADTYGGATPQETLDLFIAALRAEDVELASKYFALDEVTLNREKWIDRLRKVADNHLLNELADNLDAAIPDRESSVSQRDFKFVLLDEHNEALATVDLTFNEFSGIWKIERL